MNKKWFLAGLAVPAVAAVMAVRTPSRAADHLDSPGATNDPAGDITDVYTFLSPATAGHVVYVMNVTPNAGKDAKFSDKVEYWFRTRDIPISTVTPGSLAANGSFGLGSNAYDFKCTFDAAIANVTCAGQGGAAGLTKTVPVNQTGATCGASDKICLWAGKRSDPFFFDFGAFQQLNTTGDASVFIKGLDGGPPGNNFFNGFNVLSIVLELDVATAYNGIAGDAGTTSDAGATPILTVAAETLRTGN